MNKIRSNTKLKSLLYEISPLEMEQTKTKMKLAIRIKECMQNKGLDVFQFAELIGKNTSEITKWLSGTQNFTIDILVEIAYILDVDINFLFNYKIK